MGKKILIIDDEPEQYYEIKKWIVDIGFKEENVIPNTVENIRDMGIASKSADDICLFVEQQIRAHYKDLVLILCDIKFKNDPERGNLIVEHIRQLKGFSPSNWATLVPIIGMTAFSDDETSLKDIIKSGADYAFNKATVTKNYDNNKKMLRAIIDTQIRKFQKNLISIYPPGLQDKIIDFKISHKDKKTAFIMIDFCHLDTAKEVQRVLLDNGICGYYANATGGKNDKNIWRNIVTYMHGCDFGICIFADDSKSTLKSKKKKNKINPNVCIEVGYMLSLQKEVLYLKDGSLSKSDLPSDFDGDLYADFSDSHSLEVKLNELLINKGLK